MYLKDYENCVLVPVPGSAEAIMHELEPSGTFRENSFVIIPYAHPLREPIAPQYYRIKSTQAVPLAKESQYSPPPMRLLMRTEKATYIRHVNELRAEIQRGNIYEINYCMQFFAENVTIDPFETFVRLHAYAKAPYSMLVKLGDEYVISASPELFLEKQGDLLLTKPIKGTAARDPDPIADQQNRDKLYHSLKERTENVMAVDVARNDLSRIASRGTVEVNRLYNIESFETVHQMVSTVSCRIRSGTGFEEILAATFPMASMTGAPKISAMNLISEHEDFTRAYYSGAMGLIDAAGDFRLSVIIRSLFCDIRAKMLTMAAGGAITYLSEPEKEYEECLLKTRVMLKALNAGFDT